MLVKTFIALLLAFPLYASAAPAAQPVKEELTLANGLRVVLWEDHSFPVAVVNIRYNVGSANEGPGSTGRAHLFEHYMFRHHARDLQGEDYFGQMARLGAEYNASTSQDRTDYYDIAPAEALNRVFQLESGRMLAIGDSVNEADLKSELHAVKNEKFQRESAPYAKVMYLYLMQLVFGKDHPYEHPIIGTFEDLDSMSTDDAKAFFRRYYRPSNAVMAVVGDFDREETKALIHQWFDPIPSGPTPPAPAFPAYRQLGERREMTIKDPNAFKTRIYMAYPVPGEGQPGQLELQALADVLSNGRGTRLVDELQIKRRLVTSIGAAVYDLEHEGIFFVQATPADGVTPAQVEAAVDEVLHEVIQHGVDPDELRRATAMKQTSRLAALQDAGNMADALAHGLGADGNALSFQDELEKLSKMTPQAPQAAAATYLKPDNLAVLIVVPGGSR